MRKPQGLAEVLDDAPHLVGGDGSGQDGVLRSEVAVDPFNQLVPETPGEVEVDVGEGCHVLGDEPFQGEVPLQGIDVAYSDEVSGPAGPPTSRAPFPGGLSSTGVSGSTSPRSSMIRWATRAILPVE